MKGICKAAALAASLMSAVASPAMAQDIWDSGRDNMVAGVYLNWQFGGAPARGEDPLAFGFAASVRRADRSGLTLQELSGRRFTEIRLFDTRFNQQGFDQMSFAGARLVERRADGSLALLGATDGEEEEDEGMGTATKVLLWTGAIVGGLLVYTMIRDCTDGRDEDEVFVDFCPTD